MLMKNVLKVPLGVLSNGELIYHTFGCAYYGSSMVVNGDFKRSAMFMCGMVDSFSEMEVDTDINITLVDFTDCGCFDSLVSRSYPDNMLVDVITPESEEDIEATIDYLSDLFMCGDQLNDELLSDAYNFVFIAGLSLIKNKIDRAKWERLKLHMSEVGCYGNRYNMYVIMADKRATNVFGDSVMKWFDSKRLLRSNRIVSSELTKSDKVFDFDTDGAAYLINRKEQTKVYVSI